MKSETLYTVLAVVVLTLLAIPVGGALVLGFVLGDSPCIMCWEQRIGMLIIGLLGLFILRYGARPRFIGMAILVASWGTFMAVRHTALHAARDIGQGFSIEIMGAHTYTWALFIYWICVATMGGLLLVLRERDVAEAGAVRTLRPLDRVAMIAFLVLVAANMVQAFASTGPPPFVGQSDPIRFSFNPRHWVWSLEEWHLSAYPVSKRGRFDVERPDVAKTNPDPAAGPFADLPVLEVVEQRPLGLPLRGTPTDLAYEPTTDRFVLTTQLGIYILPAAMDRIERYTVVDPGFSVDLGTIAGTAFLDPHTVIAVGENKSFVIVRENDSADADANFRYFLESTGAFDDVTRGRFTTVRARTMFTMATAFDEATQWVYTLAVPNARSQRLVVSRFDRSDLTLSEEFVPTIGETSPVRLQAGRGTGELYITAAAVREGTLYALSANFATLLTIDLATHAILAAETVPGLVQPTGMAITDRGIHIVCADGTLVVAKMAKGSRLSLQQNSRPDPGGAP